jgi:hypothetical protein
MKYGKAIANAFQFIPVPPFRHFSKADIQKKHGKKRHGSR